MLKRIRTLCESLKFDDETNWFREAEGFALNYEQKRKKREMEAEDRFVLFFFFFETLQYFFGKQLVIFF